MDANLGYHADKKDNCGRCHSDHNGRPFELVYWPRDIDNFDHIETGYSLTGKHKDVKCNQCHTKEFIVGEEIRQWAQKYTDFPTLDRTFLGLSQECNVCHEDIHKDDTSDKCQSCHNTTDWKQVRDTFDHDQARYILTGAHRTTECEKCHPPLPNASKPVMQLTGLVFKNCIPCHEDVHKDEVSDDCKSCHNTVDWKTAQDEFDHNRARFILTGAHKKVACEKCHDKTPEETEKVWTLTGMAFDNCSRCHKDVHKGSYGNTCETCHTTVDWKQDLKPFDHNKTDYPLKGKHSNLKCAACHTPESQGKLPKFGRCLDCHVDKHDGQFVRRQDQGDCKACHTVNGFKPTTFTLSMHQAIRFTLKGSHLAVPCSACHEPYLMRNGESTTRFVWQQIPGCDQCHKDVHRNQFARRYQNDCGACHTENDFKSLIFDHQATAFPLDGKHQNVACEKCHEAEQDTEGIFVRYQPVAHKCVDCHTLTKEIR